MNRNRVVSVDNALRAALAHSDNLNVVGFIEALGFSLQESPVAPMKPTQTVAEKHFGRTSSANKAPQVTAPAPVMPTVVEQAPVVTQEVTMEPDEDVEVTTAASEEEDNIIPTAAAPSSTMNYFGQPQVADDEDIVSQQGSVTIVRKKPEAAASAPLFSHEANNHRREVKLSANKAVSYMNVPKDQRGAAIKSFMRAKNISRPDVAKARGVSETNLTKQLGQGTRMRDETWESYIEALPGLREFVEDVMKQQMTAS